MEAETFKGKPPSSAVMAQVLIVAYADELRRRAKICSPSSTTPLPGVAMSSPIGFREFNEDDAV